MSDVAIAGIGLHPFGRFEDRSITDMGAHAVQAALREAEIVDRRGFQATFCGTAYGGVAAAHKVFGRLSLTGGPIVDVEAGCASGAAALMLGAAAIAPVSTTPCWSSASRRCRRASSARRSSSRGGSKPDSRRRRPTSPCAPSD